MQPITLDMLPITEISLEALLKAAARGDVIMRDVTRGDGFLLRVTVLPTTKDNAEEPA
jgi:hypothetical protein